MNNGFKEISNNSHARLITSAVYLTIADIFRRTTGETVIVSKKSSPSLFPRADLMRWVRSRLTGSKYLLYRVHAKNHMPQEFHHPPTLRIALFRVDDPLADLFVVTQRPLQNTLPRDCELCATSSADLSGSWIAQLLRIWRMGGRRSGRVR